MKRILSALLLLMLLTPAFAEESGVLAAYDALLKEKDALLLEMQIVELELQLSAVREDEAALTEAEAKKAALQNEINLLTGQAVQAIGSAITALEAEAGSIRAQIDNLGASLEENAALQADLAARYKECMEIGAPHASAKGFLSDVTVYLLLDDAGAITALHVDASRETPFIGSRCGEDQPFLSQFIGKTGPFTLWTDVDALAGATYTSKAVVNAINSFFPAEEEPVPTEYTASARGLLSDVTVTIALNADGTVASISVDCSGETEAIARPCTEDAFLSQFIGRRGPFDDVDVVAGATYTSRAVIEAVNGLFEEGADPE